MRGDLPRLVVGDQTQHGVAAYAKTVAAAVKRLEPSVELVHPDRLGHGERAHLHFTDRLWAASPDEAASRIERLAERSTLTVTLHDLPQASDGSRNLDRRVDAYRRVTAAARGIVCNSHHEAALLDEFVGPVSNVTVVPLALEPHPASEADRSLDGTAGVLGYFYPGKGHSDVVDALASSATLPRGLTVIGRSSPGHEAELDELVAAATARGVTVEVTGFLAETDLVERCRRVSVPVAMHRHVSASGSIATWIACGRRPLVPDTRYSRELQRLRPGTVRLVPPGGLRAAIDDARAHPESTWIETGVSTAPHTLDVARAHLAWWRDGVDW